MAITTYSELQTAASTNWLARSDLANRVKEFIALAEADIRRDLRRKSVRASLASGTTGTATVPATAAEIRAIRFNTSSLKYPLTRLTEAALADVRRTDSGRPHYFAVVGDEILWDVTPDTSYDLEITYFEKLVPLSDAAPVNSTLTESPDIYLYGTLIHSAPYLEHDERVATWRDFYDRAVVKENIDRERKELTGGLVIVNLPVVFG